EPDKNTLVIVSLPLPPGRPPLLTVRWPGATGLTSYLSGCFLLTSRRCRLQHRRRFSEVHRFLPNQTSFARLRLLPVTSEYFVSPFDAFGSTDSLMESVVFARPVLVRSSNHLPSGNCDSLKPE